MAEEAAQDADAEMAAMVRAVQQAEAEADAAAAAEAAEAAAVAEREDEAVIEAELARPTSTTPTTSTSPPPPTGAFSSNPFAKVAAPAKVNPFLAAATEPSKEPSKEPSPFDAVATPAEEVTKQAEKRSFEEVAKSDEAAQVKRRRMAMGWGAGSSASGAADSAPAAGSTTPPARAAGRTGSPSPAKEVADAPVFRAATPPPAAGAGKAATLAELLAKRAKLEKLAAQKKEKEKKGQ
eukprot:TRINITY_DN30319_c0_g1_i1.p2 TRINITY_DN30319_c0_g1~~TRINITY_DN30319_c0_g1_i1.p2  ORF type:complete len:275 (+),score=94.14 TRINITY_DN30319_c0_g1_i1:117-827(+)